MPPNCSNPAIPSAGMRCSRRGGIPSAPRVAPYCRKLTGWGLKLAAVQLAGDIPMKLASLRLVTHDLDRLAAFYASLTGVAATRLTPDFAEIRLAGAVLALSTERPIRQFNAGAAVAAANRSAII